MGVYGGYNFEGAWDEDPYSPNRFFSFYQDEEIKEVVSKEFEIIRFDIVDSSLHQIMMRRFVYDY
jgi:Holliday junction resolvasome RuvABC ATP-dependent DNA helicase subunit